MEKHENTLATSQREQFGSRIAFVLASMGGAIGLGNVWKFPYMVGKYGGAAFIVVYLIALLFIGAPILTRVGHHPQIRVAISVATLFYFSDIYSQTISDIIF